MRQAVWTGSINFGLVSIPVRLYPATEPQDVRFHLYDRRSGKRVRYERVVRDEEAATFAPEPGLDRPFAEPSPSHSDDALRPADDGELDDEELDEEAALDEDAPALSDPEVVDAGDIVRGYELPSGDFVTVSDDELESLAPERSRTVEIEEFVDLAEIDPVFFEKSYYVAPVRNMGADKPYVLLHRAMRASKMVGVGSFVLRTKPHLVAIRPLDRGLALETLFFGDEVRNPDEVARMPEVTVSDAELKTAQQLIGAMATEWVPEKHADTYRQELLALLRSKPAKERAEDALTPTAPVADLMAILKASVEAAKKKAESEKSSRTKRIG